MKTLRQTMISLVAIGVVASTFLFPVPGHSATLRDVVISELAWMGTPTSYTDEWIELYNNTAATIDLTGWVLSAADGTPTINLTGTIPAHSHFLLERSDDNSVPGVPYDQDYAGDLGNDGEILTLRDNSNNLIDQIDCGAGWFAGHNEAKVPMVRVETTVDGSLASNWTHNPRCGTATNTLGDTHECLLTATPVPTNLEYAVYFNELATTATETTTDPTVMETRLLELIDNASSTIDIALYGLNRQSVIDDVLSAV
jgi:hypothetical protein